MTLVVESEPEVEPAVELRGGAALIPRPAKFRDKDAGRSVRRSLPIHGYFGRNGGGKSLAMVHDTLPDLYRGDPVLSTVELLDAETGDPYPNYTRLTDWDQVMNFSRGAICFDEIVGVAGAREAQTLPVQVQNLLVQLRRGDVALRWTAPAWARADKIIRETSQGATLCKGMFAKTVRDEAGRQLTWRQRRLFSWTTYNAEDFEDWTSSKEGKLKRINKSYFWAPGARAPWSYDTYSDVSRVSLVLDSGRCASCGGVRRAKPCTCSEYTNYRPSARVSRASVGFSHDTPR